MESVTVTAIHPFIYHGKQIHKHEAVTLLPLEAAQYGASGFVSLDPTVRATYRTRDMVAARPAAAAVAVAVVEPVDPPALGRRRRRTRKVAA